MAASTPDRCRRRRRRCPLRPGPSLLHLSWPSTPPPFVYQIDAHYTHMDPPMPPHCVYVSVNGRHCCVCSVCWCVGFIASGAHSLGNKSKRSQRLPRQLSADTHTYTHTHKHTHQTRTGHGDPPGIDVGPLYVITHHQSLVAHDTHPSPPVPGHS